MGIDILRLGIGTRRVVKILSSILYYCGFFKFFFSFVDVILRISKL